MENITSPLKSKVRWLKTKVLLLMFFTFLFLSQGGIAQITITTGDPNTASGGSGWMVFNFVNNNSFPVIITDVSVESNTTATNAEAYIYTNATPVNGAPGAISTSPG